MGSSKAQKAESREKLLEIAAKKIKNSGFASLSIMELMKEAGLTNGAFYVHFKSRDDLLVQALVRAGEHGMALLTDLERDGAHPSLEKIVNIYLSAKHVSNPGWGCAVSALAGDARASSKQIGDEMTKIYAALVGYIAKSLKSKNARRDALAITSILVGAVTTARSLNDPNLVKSILEEAKKTILQTYKSSP